MIRVVLFLAALAAAAFGISWLLDRPGEVSVLWLGERVETSVFVALGVIFLLCVVFTILWSVVAFVFRVPGLVSLTRRMRRQARGHDALSRGMIAVGAGDARAARRAASEAARAIPHEPMGLLLRAQVAQMEGDRSGAESAFTEMAGKDSTRLLGLRGLHVEARRRGDATAAHRFASEAHRVTPLPWSGEAIVAHHATQSQWSEALATVESNARAKAIDVATAQRQRAVLETAIAQDDEFVDSDRALKLVRTAAKRAPDLIPAVALAARLLSRRGDFRAASKIVERAWDETPHPELAAAYLGIRPGDSNTDRFARATTLARRMPDHPESRLLVAEAALAIRDFARARQAMASLITEGERPTTRQCLMMADIENIEHGETGLLREWLARASRAPRDPAWVADGVTSARWAPVSPVTGRLDAFRWETPREELGTPPREPATAPISVEAPRMETTTLLPEFSPEPVPAPELVPALMPEPEPVHEPMLKPESVSKPVPSPTQMLPPIVDPAADAKPVAGPLIVVPAVAAEPVAHGAVEAADARDLATVAPGADRAAPNVPLSPSPTLPHPAHSERMGIEPPQTRLSGPVDDFGAPKATRPVIFPLATSPDDPGPRPKGSPYSGGFRS